MSTITVKTEWDNIADYVFIRKKIITDKEPRSKRGVSGYRLVAYFDKGWHWYAEIDAMWFMCTIQSFDTAREASNWIRKYLYNGEQSQ